MPLVYLVVESSTRAIYSPKTDTYDASARHEIPRSHVHQRAVPGAALDSNCLPRTTRTCLSSSDRSSLSIPQDNILHNFLSQLGSRFFGIGLQVFLLVSLSNHKQRGTLKKRHPIQARMTGSWIQFALLRLCPGRGFGE